MVTFSRLAAVTGSDREAAGARGAQASGAFRPGLVRRHILRQATAGCNAGEWREEFRKPVGATIQRAVPSVGPARDGSSPACGMAGEPFPHQAGPCGGAWPPDRVARSRTIDGLKPAASPLALAGGDKAGILGRL